MQHLLLLHGAIGAKDQMLPLGESLANDFYVHRINFTGHGGEALPDAAWSIELFAQQVLNYLDSYVPAGEPVYLFGYSMGGYVGMYLNRHYPDKLLKTVTLATKFHWDEAGAAREVKMLDPETILQKLPAFAEQLAKRHAPQDWKLVMEHTGNMLLAMGKDNPLKPEDYDQITTPCLLLLGDRDKMVTLDETVGVYKKLPAGQLGVLPATPHALEQVSIKLLSQLIRKFILSK
jgi:pimeloyl-ACP methyl ester carboxylesterase